MPSMKPSENPENNFYPSILESIAEGIVVIGLDRKVIFINKMARDLIGLGDEKVEGKPCREVVKTDLCTKHCPFDCSETNESCAAYFMNINLYTVDGFLAASDFFTIDVLAIALG